MILNPIKATSIMFLDIIHRLVHFLKKHNVSETGLSPSSGKTYSVGSSR
jgi:hypothetical protein